MFSCFSNNIIAWEFGWCSKNAKLSGIRLNIKVLSAIGQSCLLDYESASVIYETGGFEMLVGDKVREARISSGMTQSELANVLKCSAKTINRIEHNKRELTLDEVKLINDYYSIDLLKSDESDSVDKISEQTLASINRLSLNVEDVKFEIIKNERRNTLIVVLVMLFIFIFLFISFVFLANWKSPRDTSESIIVEYIYSERS